MELNNGACTCCGQPIRWAKGKEYPIAGSLFIDGVFTNDLPAMLGIVTFDDGARIPCMLNRITEQFCKGTMGAANRKVQPVSFRY